MTRIGLIADVHMRESAASEVEAELERIVDRFEEFRPDHAFVLGDLIQHGDSAAEDRRRVERVRSALDPIPAPVTYLPGNHDVETLSTDELADALDQPSLRGAVAVEGVPVVYLDSTRTGVPGARGELGLDQLAAVDDLLDRVIAAARDGNESRSGSEDDEETATDADGTATDADGTAADADPGGAFVLSHHPVGPVDLSENVWFGDFPERAYLGDRKELLGTLTRRLDDARATISGHVHDTQRSSFWGLDHVVVGPVSKERPGKPVTGTHAELVVEGDEATLDVRVGAESIASYEL